MTMSDESPREVTYTSTVFHEDGTSETKVYPPGPPITIDDLARLSPPEQ